MRSIQRRTIAAFTALIIGAAGFATGVAPASAGPGGILWMGGPGVSPASPYASDHVTLSVHVQGPGESLCTPGNAPTITWDDGAGRSGTLPAPGFDGYTLMYAADLGAFPVGSTTITTTAGGGCAQPNSETPPTVTTYAFAVTAVPEPEPEPAWPPANDSRTISGTVWQVHDDVATPLVGATVLLAATSGGAVENYGPTTTTDELGRYSATLHGDVGAPLVTLAVLPPDLPAVYYRTGASATSGSPQDQSAATELNSENWDVSALYDVFVDFGDTPEESDPPAPEPGGWEPIPAQHLTAGVTEYDETFTPAYDGGWDWTWSATITVDGLPLGLDAVASTPAGVGTPPRVRITGTPLRDGPATVRLSGIDTRGTIRYIDVEFDVAAPECSEVFHYSDLSFHDTATRWLGLCRFDGTLRDALGRHTSRALDAVGAFAGLGEITVGGSRVWAEDVTETFDDDGQVWHFVDYDVDAGAAGLVDVTVDRHISGSTAIWTMEAYVAGTGFGAFANEADIVISGTVGSNGSTAWFTGGPTARISVDAPGSRRPIVVHSTSGTFTHAVDGDPDFSVSASGSLSYVASIVDYDTCAYRDSIASVTAALPYLLDLAHLGEEFTVGGEACVPIWDGTDIVARVGDTIDVTVRAIADGPFWDFALGGTSTADVSDVTGGFTAELVDQGVSGVGPGVRIRGTVTAGGEFGIPITASDGVVTSSVSAWVHLLPALAGEDEDPEKAMSIDLEAEIGDIVGGTDVTVTGTGLADASTWELIVHSTPQLIGSGSAAVGGTIATTATIPAGLEAGWHSLTFTGTWFDSSAASTVLWFQLDAAGRLIGTSSTAPAANPVGGTALGATGAVHDGSDGRFGLLLLVTGLGALTLRRARRFGIMGA